MIYRTLLKPILFLIPPEQVHHISISFLELLQKVPGATGLMKKLFCKQNPKLEKVVCGIRFPNPVGLAAGFDKNGKHVGLLNSFGFGFIEVGTVTPLPQPGNELPRLFRLPADEALINRMGFNNQGVDVMVEYLKKIDRDKIVIGGNIGKNKTTPNENAVRDYLICFEKLFDFVDYFAINVSSPNTPGLRSLQEKEPLMDLLDHLQRLNQQHEITRPIFLKIAPDLTESQLDDIVEIILATNLSGVIATNTTVSRKNLITPGHIVDSYGAGGLSGKPLKDRSTEVIRYLHEKSQGKFAIIGVGGINSAKDAIEKLNAGADLVQIYTGFIYQGPSLVKEINKSILKDLH